MLEMPLLLAAYRQGIFPMAINARGEIGWFSPDPRALLPLDDRFHIPHGLERTLRKSPFTITVDQSFPEVIEACAGAHGSTWISKTILASYNRLHEAGYAHSVEVRRKGRLAGGLYGVHIGAAFFGESMFHWETDASKVGLVALIQRLRERKFLLLDTQWVTPHLARFGAFEIPRADYLRRLQEAIVLEREFV